MVKPVLDEKQVNLSIQPISRPAHPVHSYTSLMRAGLVLHLNARSPGFCAKS